MCIWPAIVLLLLLPATAGAAVSLEPVGTFAEPIHVTAPPGDASRVFVVQRGGTVRLVKNGVPAAQPFLTIPRDELSTDGERGLLAMTFAADYTSSGRLYTYSTDAGGDIRIDLWRRSADRDVASPSRSLVLRIEHSSRSNHNGGDLQIGPDGLLYASTGDGGGGDDPDANGQTLIRSGTPDQQSTALLGKLLRIAPGANGGYEIPPDNPFAGRADARGEIFAYGLRNPFRFSFDRATGDLLLADVGQDDAEEVNFSRTRGRGANFGWRCFEGALPNDGAIPPCTPPGHVPPVFEYDRAGCQAITGGHVVRDPGLPTLLGRYLYADFCDGVIRSIVPSTGAGDAPIGVDVQDFTLTAFGEDACGRIHVVQISGEVSRLVDGSASACVASNRDGDALIDVDDACPDAAALTADGCPPVAIPPGPVPPPPPAITPAAPPAPALSLPPALASADADRDGVAGAADRCPAAAHRTSDGCAAFLRLTVTTPQKVVSTRRLSIRALTSNVSGRVRITGGVRHRGRRLNASLQGTTITIAAGRPERTSLRIAAATRRLIARRAASGRVEIDLVARGATMRATARVRIRLSRDAPR